jgi:hypothetical protein
MPASLKRCRWSPTLSGRLPWTGTEIRARWGLAIDAVTAVDAQQLPAVTFEQTAESLAREGLHLPELTR